MFENKLFFSIEQVYSFSNSLPQTKIPPVLSPEMNKLGPFFSPEAKAETDPLWPVTAFLHLSSYQKYIEPLVIPLNM